TYEEYVQRFPSLAKELQLQFEVHSGLDWTDLETELNHQTSEPEFDGFRIDSELGRGTFGTVYKAWEHTLQRYVAIKLLAESVSSDEVSTDEQFKEAQSIARLTHPNIVQIHSVNRSDCRVFFTQELVEGGTLANFIQSRPQDPRESATMVAWLADAIHYAHICQVIHCDLKPANILLRPNSPTASPEQKCKLTDFQPKISDFGLARHLDTDSVVQNNHLSGTLQYMAPEQTGIDGAKISASSDIYSLGAILYELLTGRPPFSDSSKLSVFLKVRNESPPKPRQLRPSIPGDLEAICLKCLEKLPQNRYSSADELAADLRRYLAGYAPVALTTNKWGHLSRWAHRQPGVALLSVSLLLATIVGFAAVTNRMLAAQLAQQKEQQRADELDASLYRNQIRLASMAWDASDVGRTQKILLATSPSRRSIEWHYLNSLCNPPIETQESFAFQTHNIASVAISPDDRVLALADRVGTITLLDRSTRATLHALNSHQELLTPPVFDPLGKTIAVAGEEAGKGWIWLWDVSSGELNRKLGPFISMPVFIGFSKSDERLTVVSWVKPFTTEFSITKPYSKAADQKFFVEEWDLASGKKLLSITGPLAHHLYRPKGQLSPDLQYFAWTPSDRVYIEGGFPPDDRHQVQIVDAKSGAVTFNYKEHKNRLNGVAFSPDSKTLSSFGEDGTCVLWSLTEKRILHKLKGHSDAILTAAFSSDGKILATGGHDQSIRLWNVSTGEEHRLLRGNSGSVQSLQFTNLTTTLLSSDDHDSITQWRDLTNQGRTIEFSPGLTQVAFSNSSTQLLIADLAGHLQSYNFANNNLQSIAKETNDFSICPIGDELAIIGEKKKIRVGSPKAETSWLTWEDAPAIAPGLYESMFEYSPNGKELAGIDRNDGQVWLFSVSKKQRRALQNPMGVEITRFAFQSDGSQLAGACEDGILLLWDVKTGRQRGRIATGIKARRLAFRPSATDLATTAIQDSKCRIWDSTTGQLRLVLDGHKKPITCMTYTPDGLRLLTGSEDRTVKIWDAESGEELMTLKELDADIQELAVSNNNQALVVLSASYDFQRSKLTLFGNVPPQSQKETK
ncbi:MAG: protein kinase, partial [Pirellula sp.]